MFAVPVAAVGAFGGARDHASGAQPLLADRHGAAGRARVARTASCWSISPTTWCARGMDRVDAMIEAARERFRPIVMTTCSMIAGMTPLALALDPGGAQRPLGHRRDRRPDQLARSDARARAGHVHLACARTAGSTEPTPRQRSRQPAAAGALDVADAALRRAADARHGLPRARPARRLDLPASPRPAAVPNYDVPSIQVLLTYPGASTTEMRDAIVRPLEDQLAGAPDLDHLETSIQPGQASIVAVFPLTSDQNNDLVQVQGRVQNAQHQLPNDLQTPQISIYNPSEAVVVSLVAVVGDALARRSLVARDQQDRAGARTTPRRLVRSGKRRRHAVDPGQRRSAALQSSGFTLTDVINADHEQQRPRARRHPLQPNRETNLDVRGDIQTCPRSRTCCSATPRPLGARRRPARVYPWSASARLYRVGDVANVHRHLRNAARLRVHRRHAVRRARHAEVGRHERSRPPRSSARGAARRCARSIRTSSSRSSTCSRPTPNSSSPASCAR